MSKKRKKKTWFLLENNVLWLQKIKEGYTMKKFAMLALAMSLFLVACGEKKEEAKSEAPVELKKVDFLLELGT